METKKEIQKQIITFLAITTIISTGVFLWLFNDPENSGGIGAAMMYVPGVSAILSSLLLKGKISSFGWRLGKLKYLGWAYLLPLVVAIIAYGLVWISGIVEFSPEEVQNYRWAKYIGFDLPAPFIAGFISKAVLGTLMGVLFTFGEELGWSGYLTPKLLKVKSIPVTSLIVGIIWAVWHYPAIIGGVYGVGTPLWISLPAFTLSFIGVSLIRTVLVSKSKSLWTGVILHSSHNLILMSMFWEMTVRKGIASYLVSETGIVIAIIYIIVAILFWRIQVNISTD
jgi:membrane protease YdiL (CAAX protease family)